MSTQSQTLTIPQAVQLANQYYQTGNLQATQAICNQILQVEPQNSVAFYLLGSIAAQVEHYAKAISLFQQAIKFNSSVPAYHGNLGNLFKTLGQFEEALKCYQQVLALEPNSAKASKNIGNVLRAQHKLAEAIPYYQRALALEPAWAEAHLGYSLTLLTKGDFTNGWQEYEWRLQNPIIKTPQLKPQLKWEGDDLAGRKLLIHWEQGFGDTIQFVRYLAQLKNGTLILACQSPLDKLLKSFSNVDILIAHDQLTQEPKIAYDVWVPLLSLPRIFTTTLDNIPAPIPYLFPNPAQVKTWKSRFDSSHFKIGIVWAGNPRHKNDRNRSCPLIHFAAFAKLPKVKLFSLQKGEATTQSVPEGMELISLTDGLVDFSETAAAIAGLDLVICVDTAVAHLTGAMGKPVWVLLPFNADWRWLLDRNDSPWYPTMRLFQQPSFGDWETVFKQVVNELFGMVQKHN
jgi:tetratricopeptide (TPR) repeat protein